MTRTSVISKFVQRALWLYIAKAAAVLGLIMIIRVRAKIIAFPAVAALAQDRGTDAAKTNIHWQH